MQQPPGPPGYPPPPPGYPPPAPGYPTPPPGQQYAYAYAPTYYQAAAPPQRPRSRSGAGLWILIGGAALVVVIAFGVIAALAAPKPVNSNCPPNCRPGPPPSVKPLPAQETYSNSQYGWTMDVDRSTRAYRYDANPKQQADGLVFTMNVPSNTKFAGVYPASILSEKTSKSAQQLVQEIQKAKYPSATLVYSIPWAEIGYTPGYGAVYDVQASSGSGQSQRRRLVVEVAVKKGLAIEFVCLGDYTPSTHDDGHPNPSDTKLGSSFDSNLDGVRWPGDPII